MSHPENPFPRLELITGRVTGNAQQVLLVELSRFAAKVGDYERAIEYIQNARVFDPSSWELYNICLITGEIALDDGRVNEAAQCLADAIAACLAYERARARCCIRAPNLKLAHKLLGYGKRDVVLEHLSDCRNVWEILQQQIDDWIRAIDRGETPEFLATGNLRVPERPSHTLRMQWLNACSLAQGPVSSEDRKVPVKTPAERLVERECRVAKNGPLFDAVVREKIEYLEKDLIAPPDQPPTDPADSRDTE